MVDVEIIRFHRPTREGNTLYVTGIPFGLPLEEKMSALERAFSEFGPIYDVILPQSAPIDDTPHTPIVAIGNTEYGLVQFYSSLTAKDAQRRTNRILKIGGQTIRVQFARPPSTPHTSHPHTSPLHITKCHQLCNYYFGFNGWSTEIVSMEEVEREEEEEEGERGGGGGRGRGGREGRREHEGEGGGRRGGGGGREERRGVRFRCRVKLILCEDGGVCVGVGEGEMEQPSADREVESYLLARKVGQRIAYNRACEDAFSQLIIVLLPGRKPTPVIAQSSDDCVRCAMGNVVSTCPPVTLLPRQPEQEENNESTSDHI